MRPDAHDLIMSLIGKTVFTLGQGKPNEVLRIEGNTVIVATSVSPSGQPIPLAEVQAALDSLYEAGEVVIDRRVVGYRSAFIGAVLATLPGTEALVRPRRVRLTNR